MTNPFDSDEKLTLVHDLSTGFTKNKVYQVLRESGEMIILKQYESCITRVGEYRWYGNARRLLADVLDLFIVLPKMICSIHPHAMMSYIHDMIPSAFISHQQVAFHMALVIQEFKKHGPINKKNNGNWRTYYDRVVAHVSKNDQLQQADSFLTLLKDHLLTVRTSFAHGDFSTLNCFIRYDGARTQVCLIDPIYEESIFQSYEIDIAKMYFSMMFYLYDHLAGEAFLSYCGVTRARIMPLVIAECIRVATYKSTFTNVANTLIYELINNRKAQS